MSKRRAAKDIDLLRPVLVPPVHAFNELLCK